MTSNSLLPGQGGAPAPSPEDDEPQGGGVPRPVAPATALQGPPGNPLGGAPAPAPSPMLQHFGSATDEAAAQYSKVKEAVGHMAAVRKELDQLLSLRDTVTSDDLTKAATGVVSSGAMSPTQMASMLAEAPEGGEALAAWVADKDQQVQQTEAQMGQALAISRHKMGVAALRQLMAHGAEHAQTRGSQMAQPQNPLTIH